MSKSNGVLAALGRNVRGQRDVKQFPRRNSPRNVARFAKALGLTTAELCKGVDA